MQRPSAPLLFPPPRSAPAAALQAEDTGYTGTKPPPRGRARPPVVERIATWSARHRKTALLG